MNPRNIRAENFLTGMAMFLSVAGLVRFLAGQDRIGTAEIGVAVILLAAAHFIRVWNGR